MLDSRISTGESLLSAAVTLAHLHWTACVSRLLETETVCPMCSETLSVKQVKKISDCSKYLQADELDQWRRRKDASHVFNCRVKCLICLKTSNIYLELSNSFSYFINYIFSVKCFIFNYCLFFLAHVFWINDLILFYFSLFVYFFHVLGTQRSQ